MLPVVADVVVGRDEGSANDKYTSGSMLPAAQLELVSAAPWRRKEYDEFPKENEFSMEYEIRTAQWRGLPWRKEGDKSDIGSPSGDLAQSLKQKSSRFAFVGSKCLTSPSGCFSPDKSQRRAQSFTRRFNLMMPKSVPDISDWKEDFSSSVSSSRAVPRPAENLPAATAPPFSARTPRTFYPLSQEMGEPSEKDEFTSEMPSMISSAIAPYLTELARVNSVWDSQLWLKARKEAASSNDSQSINFLLKCVWTHTQKAVRQQRYWTDASSSVDLTEKLSSVASVDWFGWASVCNHPNAVDTKGPKKIAPPLLICESSPLDVAMSLHKLTSPGRPIILVVEVGSFTEAGSIDVKRFAAMNPQCLPLRSDFPRYAEAAESWLRSAKATVQQHLTTGRDPYAFLCRDVTVFRGPHEQGYPFVKEPMKIHLLVISMSASRPAVQLLTRTNGRTEWYQDEADHTALLERLNLVGLVAQQEFIDERDQKPILVLSSPGSSSTCPHPRDAVANSLNLWRRRFSPHLHAVFVCTGGRSCGAQETSLAQHLDEIVNRQVHKVTEDDTLVRKFLPWHWDPVLLRMCTFSHKLQKAAMLINRATKSLDKTKPPRRDPDGKVIEEPPSRAVGQKRSSCVVAQTTSMRREIIESQANSDSEASQNDGLVGSDSSSCLESESEEAPPPTTNLPFHLQEKRQEDQEVAKKKPQALPKTTQDVKRRLRRHLTNTLENVDVTEVVVQDDSQVEEPQAEEPPFQRGVLSTMSHELQASAVWTSESGSLNEAPESDVQTPRAGETPKRSRRQSSIGALFPRRLSAHTSPPLSASSQGRRHSVDTSPVRKGDEDTSTSSWGEASPAAEVVLKAKVKQDKSKMKEIRRRSANASELLEHAVMASRSKDEFQRSGVCRTSVSGENDVLRTWSHKENQRTDFELQARQEARLKLQTRRNSIANNEKARVRNSVSGAESESQTLDSRSLQGEASLWSGARQSLQR